MLATRSIPTAPPIAVSTTSKPRPINARARVIAAAPKSEIQGTDICHRSTGPSSATLWLNGAGQSGASAIKR